jgi:restriction system protein
MASKSDLPSYELYFGPTVEALKSRGGSATIEELEEDVAERMRLTPEVLAVPHGDGPRTQFEYELAWVRTYLKKVGALENSERGVWRLTPRGSEMSVHELLNVPKTVRAEERRQRTGRTGRPADVADIFDQEGESEAEVSWKEQLLDLLLKIQPDAFERLCQRLLREAGFVQVRVTGRSGDGGIDGIGVLRVRLVTFQVLFQSKRWKDSVPARVVRDFRGAMVGRADKGLIITTATFTPDARREASRDGAPAIDLVDGDTLCDLLKEYGIGVSVEKVERVTVDEKAFSEI